MELIQAFSRTCVRRALAFVACAALSLPASALVIQADDPVFGNDSVIRDIDNGRDFLQLVFTMGRGYNDIVSEFGAGGDFEGWSVASTAQLLAMGASAGISHGSTSATEVIRAEELRDWFCVRGATSCVALSTTHEVARGLVLEDGPLLDTKNAFTIGRRFNVNPEEVDLRVSGYGFTSSLDEEVWLSRRTAAVPAPTTLALLGLGLAALGLRRRR